LLQKTSAIAARDALGEPADLVAFSKKSTAIS
jgi:hypothetical protein